MKKNSLIIISWAATYCFLCGCSQHEESSMHEPSSALVSNEQIDPFSPKDTAVQNTDDIRFSWGFVQPSAQIQYDDDMQMQLFIENASEIPADFGIMIFVDGMLQTLDAQSDQSLSCFANLNGNERKEFSPAIRPMPDGGLDAHDLQMGLVYDPMFQPETVQTVYGHHHRMTGLNISIEGVQKSTDAETQFKKVASRSLTKEEQEDQYNQGQNDLTQLRLEKEKIENDTAPNSFTAQDHIKAVLRSGTKSGVWRISMYCSNRQVSAFDGENYVDFEMKAGEIAECECDLSCFRMKGNNAVYLVAVPLEKQDETLIQSHVMTFAGDGE